MRRYVQLSACDRIRIQNLRKRRFSISEIALALRFHKSTISRELDRGRRNKFFKYRWDWAQAERNLRKSKAISKRKNTVRQDTLDWVAEKLRQKWSPEQIAGRSKIDGPQQVSHEFIYRYIVRDRKQGGKLYKHLRRAANQKYRFRIPGKRSKIPNRVDISTRPKIISERKRLGDLEGDTIIGRHQLSHVVVVADRVSRLVGLEKVKSKTTAQVNQKLKQIIKRNGKAKTITFDNGLEFSGHDVIKQTTGIKTYFTHAYAAWERGTVENMNGLLRQYLPKKTDFRKVSEKRIRFIEQTLNNRPRKCLGYKTPNERHYGRKI